MKNKNSFFKLAIAVFVVFFSYLENIYAETPIYELQGKKIIYTNDNNLIVAQGGAYAKDQSGKEIFADKITYNKKEANIKSEGKSIYADNRGNKLFADNFHYDINLKTIDAKNNVKYIDKDGNLLNFSSLKYYEELEKGIGQDLRAKLTDKSTMEGAEAEFDNKLGTVTLLKKNSYTPCENKENSTKTIPEICPDWSIDTTKTTHDKNEKMVYHRNAVLKIKNIPVFYTPYFSHPDPSVKRKSGFLPPSVKNFTDLGQTIKTPYFWAISDNKDLTFTPIYYFDENSIFLTEYRQQNEKSKFYIDSSYTQGYKNINKKDNSGNEIKRTDGTRNHLFFNFLGSYEDLLFSQNNLEVNIQRISQKNYLNVNQINTEHVKQDMTSLNNNIIFNSYGGSQRIKIESNIYENLNIEEKNLKYQYTFPSIEYGNYFNKFDQLVNISSSFAAKNLGTNSNQAYFTNQINSESEIKLLDFLPGVANVFKTSTKNINVQNQNISDSKENFNSDTYLTLGVENSLPLMKINKNTEETLTPKIFTKFTTGSMTNANSLDKMLTYQDIYSMNRMSSITNPETGGDIGYGIDYNIRKKNNLSEVYMDGTFSIGQVIKKKKLKEMPENSSLANTSSDFVGNVSFFYDGKIEEKISQTAYLKKGLNINYGYTVSNDLNKILKNDIDISYADTKNTWSSKYYETHDISNEQYIDIKYDRKIYDDFTFATGVRKNIQDSFTENNFIGIAYETDCIKISLNLAKTFYQDEDLKPSNNFTLSLVLKPFGSPISPDLSSFLN
jgi:LPS-assembly protein